MWQDIPAYLSEAIESIQKRALKIIFPNFSYQQALDQAKLSLLLHRRIFVCKKLMAEMRNKDHPISFLAPQAITSSTPQQLLCIVESHEHHKNWQLRHTLLVLILVI